MRKVNLSKSISYILSTILVIGLVGITPQSTLVAKAATTKNESNTFLGTSVLENGVNTENAATIYFDENGDTWYVIGYNGTGVASETGELTLFATGKMKYWSFVNHSLTIDKQNVKYSESSLKEGIEKHIETRFSQVEKATINKRDLMTGEFTDIEPYCDGILGDQVNDVMLWPLSTQEAANTNSILRKIDNADYQGVDYYWLRSPGRPLENSVWPNRNAAYVDSHGNVCRYGLDVSTYPGNIRVAFKMKKSKIMFSTLVSGTVNASGAKYKLTVLDDDMSINLTPGGSITKVDDTVTVPYTVSSGTNRISVLITDDYYHLNGTTIKYYGSLNISGDIGTSGTGSFTLPNTYDSQNDFIYLIAEKTNEDNLSDYASQPMLLPLMGYTLRYNSNGGTGNMRDQERKVGDGIEIKESDFTREGYVFEKWNTIPDGSGISYLQNQITDVTYESGSIVTLYAQWIPNNYTVKYDANGGTGTMLDQERIYDDEVALTTSAFAYEGYTFRDWNTSADGSGTAYADGSIANLLSSKDGTITLYAQWDEIIKYTVTWTDEDGTILETDSNVEYGTIPTYDGEQPVKANTSETVYTFAGWTPAVTAVTCDVTYTAIYAEEGAIYTIAFDANGGTVTPLTGTTNEEYKLSSLPIPVYDGYEFVGWFTLPEDGVEVTTKTVFNTNATVYAHWKEELEEESNLNETNLEDPNLEEPIPEDKSTDYLDELRLRIAIAIELGGKQSVFWDKGDSLPYDIMKKLEEHPDITLVFEYTYLDENYCTTLFGSRVKAYEDIPWYGPIYLYGTYNGKKLQ